MKRASAQRGFTLMEVLMALIVFAISVVGLVALESRSLEAQKAAGDLREAERVAQDAMAELMAESYVSLATTDFTGEDSSSFPFRDWEQLELEDRLRDFRRPPADIDADATVPGSIGGKFVLFREIDVVPEDAAPTVPGALVLNVTVLWVDDSNGVYPPPAGFGTDDLSLEQIQGDDFLPYVASVQLRRVRVNDAG